MKTPTHDLKFFVLLTRSEGNDYFMRWDSNGVKNVRIQLPCVVEYNGGLFEFDNEMLAYHYRDEMAIEFPDAEYIVVQKMYDFINPTNPKT